MKLKLLVLFSAVLLMFINQQVFGQFDRERFGKNRIQHQVMDWSFYSSNNFEVYYYGSGQANARMAIDFLEAEFERLSQLIGYVAYTKPKIFIYNSREELLESNLNLNKDSFTIDGQTFFSKLLAEVPYTGDWETFKRELIYGTSKAILEEMVYGTSITDAFQSNLINSFPYWFLEGAAQYMASGWSMEMDDYVRHYLKENKNPKLYNLKEEEAAMLGQSIWNFIVEKYGKRYISSILNLSRINRNEENSIANTIGLNFKTFVEQWRAYYTGINNQVLTTFKDINDEKVITSTSKNRIGKINDVKFSPDSKHLAYVINDGGKFRIIVRELATEKERTIYKGGYRSDDQRENFSTPIIAWKDTLNLAIGTFTRGVTTLRLRAIDGSSQDRIFLRNITQIMDLDFAPNGRNMVLSAIANGRRDIYTLNVRGQGKRLTNDIFDNITPVFLNDSTIIYASNFKELPDSVLTNVVDIRELPQYYNLFRLDVGDSTVTTRLTNSNSKNFSPRVMNANILLYFSDQSGIMNVMRYNLGSNVSSQVSAFNKSLEAFDYAPSRNMWAFSFRDGIQAKLAMESFPNVDQFTPGTPRVQLSQVKDLSERISTRRLELETQKVEIPRPQTTTSPDVRVDTTLRLNLDDLLRTGQLPQQAETAPSEVTAKPKEEVKSVFDTIPPPKSLTGRELTGAINTENLRYERKGGIDTDNYVFDTIPPVTQERSTLQAASGRSNILDAFRRQSMQKRVSPPRSYMPQFITSSLNTSFLVDPLRGFGIRLNGEMTDLLDNHSIKGGIMTTLDFRSGSDIFFEYEYLKYRLDFRGRFDRRVLQLSEGDLNFQRYVLTKTQAEVSYPLTVHTRVSLAPFVAKTQYFNLNPDSILRGTVEEQNRFDVNYVGGRAEVVVDKTNLLGLYMQQGFKGKMGLQHYQGLNRGERSFSNFYLDMRNYQKIHKSITLATRVFAGSFFGRNPQNYLVGGMDNWLFNQFYQPPSNRPEASPVRNAAGVENSNILFAEFVDLRGYDYDEIRGSNVVTFTAELRIPLFSYLSRGNIASNFVKNFQLIGFYDAGSSWTDSAPWERVNDQNTEVINTEGSPFVITLNNFNNPWLQSYGGGLRTVLFNYYVKFDVARPIRNYTTEDLRFYVTLGYNF
ncbi:TolB-like translocation protein [Pararhodonellum marinum]|uniref:biopolymer transporter Tol n=1 Tax=Pararhodonellum marinum TaxID=2755358 RepID=UPI00188F5643|nr:biopolymer transporter Tol [Pararhodonellum marinum]